MPMNCTCILVLLLMIHWTHTFSLHSLLHPMGKQFFKDQKFESRSPLIERLRRWSKAEDHDEIEIPLDESLLSSNDFEQRTTDNAIENSTIVDFETIESNSSSVEKFDQVINSTVTITTTTIEIIFDENTTMIQPLLRQDFVELNQTNVSMIEEILQGNQTEANEISLLSTVISESIDLNQTVINENNETKVHQIDSEPDEIQSTSIPQTTDQVEPIPTIQNNQTTASDVSLNDSLIINTTIHEWIIPSNISLKDTMIINPDISINETELIPIESNPNSTEISIESSKSISIPICDDSCECLKECPYGFEILNDTCLCDPPCKNYQCFGNDTCLVTKQGQPLCQPGNGNAHERPTRCYQPRDAGYHDTNLRYYNRWYYNPDQDTCHLFVYRGLGGNENNFQTLNECHLECITCAPIPDPGECLGHTNMWYFDTKANRCQEFKYSGCKGNENKFMRKEQCIATCINRIVNL